MKLRSLRAARPLVVSLASLCFVAAAAPHGGIPPPPPQRPGTPVGPGGTSPTGPHGPGGPGAGPAPRTPAPGATGPGDVGPGAPSATPSTGPSGGPSTSTGGASPGTAATPTGGVATGSGAGSPTPSTTGARPPSTGVGTGAGSSVDLSDWQLWWRYHRDEFLDLKRTLRRNANDAFDADGTAVRAMPLPDARAVREKVLPALFELLRAERSTDVRTSAEMALAKLARGPVPEEAEAIERALVPFLADPVQEVSETTALALGLVGTRGAVQLLADLAQDGARGRELASRAGQAVPYRTRSFACYGIGLAGAHAQNEDLRRFAVHHLVQTFEQDRSASRDVKTAALVALSLVPLAPRVRTGAQEAAPASASREASLAWLLDVWTDAKESDLVRAYAATTAAHLARSASEADVAAWIDAACDVLRGPSTSAVLQQSAAMALGLLADDDRDPADARARETLQRALRSGDGLARRFAAIALARSGARAGTGPGAGEGARHARRVLLAELESASTPMRPWLALALGVHERLRAKDGGAASAEVRSALARGLVERRGPSEAGAWCVAAALARADDARDSILGWATENQDSEARPHAALALGLIGWEGAVPALRNVVADARLRTDLLRDASIALGLLGSEHVVPDLVELLSDSPSLLVQSTATTALRYVGDARAIDPLLALLRRTDRPDLTRAFAASALGGVCDLQPLPWNSELASTVDYWIPPPTLSDPATGTGILDLF